jgi:hypothetical protein
MGQLYTYLEKYALLNLSKAELVAKVLELQERDKQTSEKYSNLFKSTKLERVKQKEQEGFLHKKIDDLFKQLASSEINKEHYRKVADLKLGNTFNPNASWVDKIVFVLKDAGRPLRSSEIIEILLKNDITFRTITNKQKGLSTHLTKALSYGRIIGEKQKGQNGYLFRLPDAE